MSDTLSFTSSMHLIAPGYLRGYVFCPSAPDRVWTIGLFHNDTLITAQEASGPVARADAARDIPAFCGFGFNLTQAATAPGDRLELRVLNGAYSLGVLDLDSEDAWQAPQDTFAAGYVRHVHGLTLSGLMDDAVTEWPSYEILAYDGDRIVGRTRLYRAAHVGDAQSVSAHRIGFDLLLDPHLADGVPRSLRVETSTGQRLEGSPVLVCAYPNAFRDACAAVAERAEGPGKGPAEARMADMALYRLLDNSVPLSAYSELFTSQDLKPSQDPVPGYRVLSSCDATLTCVAARALSGMTAPLVTFDLLIETADGPYPALMPAYDHERHLEQGYIHPVFALRDDLFDAAKAAGLQTAAEIALSVVHQIDQDAILHLPLPGARVTEPALRASQTVHAEALRNQGYDAAPLDKETLFPALKLRRAAQDAAVSVIIPTRNQGEMLQACVTSLKAQNPGFELDILIVDNGSDAPDTARVLDRLEADGARILEFDAGFNYALINTLAAEHARFEQLCFLNNDVFFPEPGVLAELCSRLSGAQVGAVGPLMVRASDIIQHGGVVLGPHGGATHAFEDRMRHDPGYTERLCVAQECSAVTGAMLLTRASLFNALGGFDERLFPVNFNDVDYCLRLREAGHRVVFTPHACIHHYESVSRGRESNSPATARMMREVQNLRERWGDMLRNDPFFHPLFSIDTLPYRALKSRQIDPAPRSRAVRRQANIPAWI